MAPSQRRSWLFNWDTILLMAWSSLVSSIKTVSFITLYWKPSTWTTANWLCCLGGYSIPRAGLWMTNLASWGSFGTFYFILFLPPVLQPTIWSFRVSSAFSPKVSATDPPEYSKDTVFCGVSWCSQSLLFRLVFQRIKKTWLDEATDTEQRTMDESRGRQTHQPWQHP